MGTLVNLLLSTFLLSTVNAVCDDDWTEYKEMICIKTFDDLETYDDATDFCATQGGAGASLVLVKSLELQQFLEDFTVEIYDNIWLGGQYDEESSEFVWQDGTALTYTNWQDGFPKNVTNGDACMEMRLEDRATASERRWAHVNCKKRNSFLCQKPSSWSLSEVIAEITKMKDQLGETNSKLDSTTAELEETKATLTLTRDELEVVRGQLDWTIGQLTQTRTDVGGIAIQLANVTTAVVPVGSIYVEYYNQPSPQELWPSYTWEDATSTYAGLFFRAYGGDSDEWGTTQTECSPLITRMEHEERSGGGQYPNGIAIPASGWSPYGDAGENFPDENGQRWYEALRFYTEGCEVRPKNQAVRIWKRTA